MKKPLTLLLGIFFLSCGNQPQDQLFTKGEAVGTVKKRLEEASGLVASVSNPGYYWTHNDSGHPAEVFLIDERAKIVLICTLKGVANRDWEEVAVGPGPKDGKTYVYVGDIGDNEARYPVKLIYRFEEPIFSDQKEITISEFDTLMVKLPDGIRDSEAFTVDPLTNDLLLFSKREDSIRLYQLHYPFSKDTLLPDRIAILPYNKIVSADISPDGQEILIKDYDRIYYWKKQGQESISELLQTSPIELPYERGPQDEAICWKRDGSGFFTLGEIVKKEGGDLVFHQRK